MVNMWPGVPTECLCSTHLNAVLAESTNLLIPSMRKGHSVEKYILHGCVDLPNIVSRIEECIQEAKNRGHVWKYASPSDDDRKLIESYIESSIKPHGSAEEMSDMNKRILAFRCPQCRKRIWERKY